jgi:hypothetical protein
MTRTVVWCNLGAGESKDSILLALFCACWHPGGRHVGGHRQEGRCREVKRLAFLHHGQRPTKRRGTSATEIGRRTEPVL